MDKEYQAMLKLEKHRLSEPMADNTCNDDFTNMISVSADPSRLLLANNDSQYDTSQQPQQSDVQTDKYQQHHPVTDHATQASADITNQYESQENVVPLRFMEDQCPLSEGSHDGPTCVPPVIPSITQVTPTASTPDLTCVTDLQQITGDTQVQLMSPECQSVQCHGQAHGSASGEEGHHWHDSQHSSLSLISIHHHPCSCTQ